MVEPIVESSTEAVLNVARTERIRVLHVDDDKAFLKVAKQCLEMQGEIDVDTVSSVNEASEKLKKTDYDSVVCDYQMPGKDGLEFLKELREKGNTVPFIVFTGKGREEIAIKALNLGADRYVDKHGDPETVYCELAHAIRQATDRKSKDIELFKKEAKLQAVLESSPDAITVSDLNGNVIQCNKATLDMLGFSSKDKLIGKNGYELIAEKDRQKAMENLKKTLDQGSLRNIEYAFLTKDGHEFPTELSASVLRDSSGKVVGFVSVAKNISERKKAEEELRIQREELQVILDSMPAKIWYKDRNNRLVKVNKAFAEYMGVSKENLEGKPLCDLFPPDIAQKCWEEDKEVFTTGQPKTDILDRHESAQGVRWFSTGKVPCREKDGNIIGTINFSVDITERKQTEEALLKSEEKYRLFVQNLQGIAYRGDTRFNAEFFDGPIKEITGYSEEELLKGKIRWDKLIHEEDSARSLNNVKESISNKQKSGRSEYRIVRKDGTVKWIRQMFNHLFDDSGGVTGSQGILYDITEEKKTEEALRQSEEGYRELTESITDMFFAMDKDFRYTYWNKASERLTGISAKDAIGKSLSEVFPDVKGTKMEQVYLKTLRTQQPQSYLNKYQLRGKDYVFEINAYPTKAGLSVFAKDATEHKKAEEELKSSERKFRGLVEGSAAAIATIDLKGRLTYVNEALADSFGYSVQEMSGRAFKDFVHPDDRGNLVRLFLKIIVLRRQPRKFEFRALRKDGAILYLMCKPTRLETDGKTVGFQAIIIDNTAEKRMLEKAEKMNEKLSVVGGLTRHDVNSKLSTILNVSYLLKQKLRDNQSLELVKETESVVHQIEGLFEFARTYEKLGTEELASVDVEKVFKEVARLFPSLKDMKIVNDCRGLTVFADSLLRQLFYNLVDNSLKHGEKVSQARVHYQTDEDHLKLIYEDDGIGIPKAEKDKIFKESYGKGNGHGLYLIKKMCEVYGWTIQEKGTQGKGARFILTIPDQRAH